MRVTHCLILPFILLFSSFLGCADDFIQTGNTVTVHLMDEYGLNFPTTHTLGNFNIPNVSISDYPISLTDLTGRCRLPNVNVPYNLTVQDFDNYYCFKNVTISNPEVICMSENHVTNYNYCYFYVNMPPPGQIAIMGFISNGIFQDYPRIIYSGNNLSGFVAIPAGTNSVSCKLLLIYCDGFYGIDEDEQEILEINTFDSAAVKDIDLHPGDNDSISFSPGEIIKNLKESNITYSTQSNSFTPYTEAYFTFPGYSNKSDLMFFRQKYSNATLPVITELPVPFEIKLKSIFPVQRHESFSLLRPQVITTGQAGTNFNLEHKEILLLEPADNQTGINDNTVFKYSDDVEKGIYVIFINRHSFILTDRHEITLREIKNRGFNPQRGEWYGWSVFKISSFNNIDDFLSSPFIFRNQFTRVSNSYMRSFIY